MKMAAPNAFGSDVLHQRRTMIVNRVLEAGGQPRDLDVLSLSDLIPMFQNVPDRCSRNQKGLAAKNGFGVDEKRISLNIAGQLVKVGIIQAGQGDSPIFQWLPLPQIVQEEPIEFQIVLQKQNVFGAALEAALQRQVSIVILADFLVAEFLSVDLNGHRQLSPIRRREIVKSFL